MRYLNDISRLVARKGFPFLPFPPPPPLWFVRARRVCPARGSPPAWCPRVTVAPGAPQRHSGLGLSESPAAVGLQPVVEPRQRRQVPDPGLSRRAAPLRSQERDRVVDVAAPAHPAGVGEPVRRVAEQQVLAHPVRHLVASTAAGSSFGRPGRACPARSPTGPAPAAARAVSSPGPPCRRRPVGTCTFAPRGRARSGSPAGGVVTERGLGRAVTVVGPSSSGSACSYSSRSASAGWPGSPAPWPGARRRVEVTPCGQDLGQPGHHGVHEERVPRRQPGHQPSQPVLRRPAEPDAPLARRQLSLAFGGIRIGAQHRCLQQGHQPPEGHRRQHRAISASTVQPPPGTAAASPAPPCGPGEPAPRRAPRAARSAAAGAAGPAHRPAVGTPPRPWCPAGSRARPPRTRPPPASRHHPAATASHRQADRRGRSPPPDAGRPSARPTPPPGRTARSRAAGSTRPPPRTAPRRAPLPLNRTCVHIKGAH